MDETGQALVQQRPSGSQHAGLWEFPGGKLEPGESPQAAAVREVAEELQVAIREEDLDPVTFTSGLTVDGSRLLTIMLFACRQWHGEPQPLAAAHLAWCNPHDLARWSMPPLDYPLANALAGWLRMI